MLVSHATWHMQSHTHPHWEFIYFLRGRGSVTLPHATLHPQYYHLLAFYPGLPHAETADPLDPEETIFFSVDVLGNPQPDLPILLADPHGELRWLSERIYHETATHHALTPLANTYTRAILQLIERSWQTTAAPAADPVELAMHYLNANYASPITMEELAAMVNVSPHHLTHCFTARLGISPSQYLKSLRLEAAKQLLAATGLTVNDIAQRVGYADPLYFRRVFKAVIGYTPSAWRDQTPDNIAN